MNRAPFVPADIAAAPPAYAWDYDISRAILYPLETEHVRLAEAFGRVDQRAAMALAAGIAEWVVRRLQGHGDVRDALWRVEAAYAAAVDPARAALEAWPEDYPEEPQPVYGPLEVAGMLLTNAWQALAADDTAVNTSAFQMALLAVHVLPDPGLFEGWLSDALRRLAAAHPWSQEPPSRQAPVPPTALSDGQGAQDGMSAFLAQLDPSANPYLRAP
jgi:hypothetical protein